MNIEEENVVQILKEQLRMEEHSWDPAYMEKCLLELKTELHIKRDEVKQSRIALEIANHKINELKTQLNGIIRECDEKQYRLNISKKKSKRTEEDLNEKRDILLKTRMQYKMALDELDATKNKLQKVEIEKNYFAKKIELAEREQKFNSNYQSRILKQETCLRSLEHEVNRNMTKLTTEQQEFKDLITQSQWSVLSEKMFEEIETKYKELKKAKENIDDVYVNIKAKQERIEESVAISSRNFQGPSSMTKLILDLWKESKKNYENDLKEKDVLITKLQEVHEKENNVTSKILSQKEELLDTFKNLMEENEDLLLQIQKFKENCEAL